MEPCGVALVRCPIRAAGTYAVVHAHYGAERVGLRVHCSMAVQAGVDEVGLKVPDLELRVWVHADRPGQAERVAALEDGSRSVAVMTF